MSVSVIDEISNRDKMIKSVAGIIGKSRYNFKFFEIVYNGKTRVKTQEWIMDKGSFPSTKKVVDIGKKFVSAKIVNVTKDEHNKIAYEKIDFFTQIKSAVIKNVNANIAGKDENVQNKKIKTRYKKKINIKKWDIFICHATEDKKNVARPLAKKLRSVGLNVWYDEFELDWGMSLMKSIEEGLKNSQYGIVILSHSFFKKEWAKKEMRGLHSIAITKGEDKILPLLYDINHAELTEYSPLLSDILYKKWDEGLNTISDSIYNLLKKGKIRKNEII